MTTTDHEQHKYYFVMAEEYQDFKEYLCYKLDMSPDDFNAMYDEFVKWTNSEIKTEDIQKL